MSVTFEKAGIIGAGRPAPGWRRAALWLALGVLFLVAGCSTLRLAYGQTPRLAYWYLDRTFDFDREQAPQVRAALERWVRWHHQHEVPLLSGQLDRLAEEVTQPATAEQACRWADVVRERVSVAVDAALPDAARLARQFGPAQFAALQARQRSANEDFEQEYLQPDPQRRHRKAVERTLERIESIYGRFDAEQRARVDQLVAASPYDAERWNAERLARQAALVARLQQLQALPADDDAAARQLLRGLFDEALQSPREAYRRYQGELLRHNCQLVADVHNLTSATQREHAARTLRHWAADLRTVARVDES